ncbi:hypothetical protein BDW68DRAFT_169878 [Aspergillus falconensis]
MLPRSRCMRAAHRNQSPNTTLLVNSNISDLAFEIEVIDRRVCARGNVLRNTGLGVQDQLPILADGLSRRGHYRADKIAPCLWERHRDLACVDGHFAAATFDLDAFAGVGLSATGCSSRSHINSVSLLNILNRWDRMASPFDRSVRPVPVDPGLKWDILCPAGDGEHSVIEVVFPARPGETERSAGDVVWSIAEPVDRDGIGGTVRA